VQFPINPFLNDEVGKKYSIKKKGPEKKTQVNIVVPQNLRPES